eukprot:gene2490-3862_t
MVVDAVALTKQFVQLRCQGKNDEAAAMMVEDVKYTTPTLTGTELNEGIEKVREIWAKQDNDLPKVIDKTDFASEGDNSATRTVTLRKMLMDVRLAQTFTFNEEGKLVEHVTKR